MSDHSRETAVTEIGAGKRSSSRRDPRREARPHLPERDFSPALPTTLNRASSRADLWRFLIVLRQCDNAPGAWVGLLSDNLAYGADTGIV
jgi:hypothetical protein